ncbi:isoaspartyl peptidase/L-asparaginase [Klebsiella variicola]|uniref:isoaspartyl peptidase/L-asparaginase n=1 Tax=Klebsiella variicola TaxID=244366 RepID=UPI002378A31F|nr:isoaspartyl peptidase/L-asparaginase [Klebsiella variicola]MDD9257217.1 isoaspartyl peptidase/L-asparaginase [Klebsiella variicola]
MGKAVIAIHGGAGAISRAQMTPEREREYVAALSTIVESGQKMLAAGASALDTVTEAVRLLEECPLFNAGMGAVFTHDQTHELDACVMDGYSLQAAKAGGEIILDHHAAPLDERQKMGTVGAVALDLAGNLAAATSTGGMTNKLPGRVGDSPLPGAGCYANNASVAVSCTGTGEVFMRTLAAYDIAALMEYGQLSLYTACERVVMEKLPALGGSGGLIAVDREGNVVLPFNSEGMYRAWCYAGDTPTIGIYRE